MRHPLRSAWPGSRSTTDGGDDRAAAVDGARSSRRDGWHDDARGAAGRADPDASSTTAAAASHPTARARGPSFRAVRSTHRPQHHGGGEAWWHRSTSRSRSQWRRIVRRLSTFSPRLPGASCGEVKAHVLVPDVGEPPRQATARARRPPTSSPPRPRLATRVAGTAAARRPEPPGRGTRSSRRGRRRAAARSRTSVRRRWEPAAARMAAVASAAATPSDLMRLVANRTHPLVATSVAASAAPRRSEARSPSRCTRTTRATAAASGRSRGDQSVCPPTRSADAEHRQEHRPLRGVDVAEGRAARPHRSHGGEVDAVVDVHRRPADDDRADAGRR